MKLEFDIEEQTIERKDDIELASGGVNFSTAEFNFSNKWKELNKTALFYNDPHESYSVILVDNKCKIPAEVQTGNGRIYVGVYGVNSNGEYVKGTTNLAEITVNRGASLEGQTPPEPTPDVYSQILTELNQVETKIGQIEDKQTDTYNKQEVDDKDTAILEVAKDYADNMKVQTPGTIYVNKNSTSDTETGDLTAPYKTIQSAIDNSQFGDLIIINPAEYNESITVANKQNLTFKSEGVIGQYRVVVNGDLNIDEDSYRISFSNIQFDGDYINNSEQGLIYTDNVAVNGNVSLTGAGYHRYDYCFFNDLVLTGTALIDIRSSQCEDLSTWTINNLTGTLALTDVMNVAINHIKGNLYIAGSTTFLQVGNIPALVSTANIGEGGIRFDGGTFLQATGAFAKLEKTGTCPYTLANVIYEAKPEYTVLNGLRIDGGLHSDQIYDHNARQGYAHSTDTIKAHLDGIGNKLQETSTGLQTETTNRINADNALADEIDLIQQRGNSFGAVDKTQTELLAMTESDRNTYLKNFIVSKGGTLVGGVLVYTKGTPSNEWEYNDESSTWVDNGQSTVNTASNDIQGIVKGSLEALKILVDSVTGEMSVNGLETALNNLQTAINNKLGKTEQSIDSAKLGGQLPNFYATRTSVDAKDTLPNIDAKQVFVNSAGVNAKPFAGITYSDGNTNGSTIMQRTPGGQAKVANAVNDNEAVPLNQMNTATANVGKVYDVNNQINRVCWTGTQAQFDAITFDKTDMTFDIIEG